LETGPFSLMCGSEEVAAGLNIATRTAFGPHAMGSFLRGSFGGGVNARTACGPHAMGSFFRGINFTPSGSCYLFSFFSTVIAGRESLTSNDCITQYFLLYRYCGRGGVTADAYSTSLFLFDRYCGRGRVYGGVLQSSTNNGIPCRRQPNQACNSSRNTSGIFYRMPTSRLWPSEQNNDKSAKVRAAPAP